MSDEGEPIALRKPCRVCGEDVALQARKCFHCGSSLDWQRHLNLSSTFLALLVALISVTTVAIPVFFKALESKKSDVTMNVVETMPDAVSVLVSNKGNRPGLVSSAYLKLPVGEFKDISLTGPPPTILQPQDAKIIVFSMNESFLKNIWQSIHQYKPRHVRRYGEDNEFEMGYIPVELVIPTRDFDAVFHDLKKSLYLTCGVNNCQLTDFKPGW